MPRGPGAKGEGVGEGWGERRTGGAMFSGGRVGGGEMYREGISAGGGAADSLPIFLGSPTTMLRTPGGSPALRPNSARASAVSGVASAGFRITCSGGTHNHKRPEPQTQKLRHLAEPKTCLSMGYKQHYKLSALTHLYRTRHASKAWTPLPMAERVLQAARSYIR